ncbi:Alpha/Beta hydrolase protein [Mycena maculata]|uniref:Alpha/Beta hydrolase protein n=1 Tax=Mycena maculata TaxID=230809 RepID=A0AAD7N0N1_9AGAR|nr:Alpha/Beta hydrolase protein [Mycena maculata]
MAFSVKLRIWLIAATSLPTTWAANNSFNLAPFTIDLTSEISRLNTLANTRLPATALYPGAGPDEGIELDFLTDLRNDWQGNFDWEMQQAELNQLTQCTAVVEGQTVPSVHEKSKEADAIPVILLHGWPGSFHEFTPVIKPLTQSWTSSPGQKVSYNVVVPSLPGFIFSSVPPANWIVDDTARIFNTLMTEVLGYPTYALDWGSSVGYSLYSSFNTTVRAGHFTFLPFLPPTTEEITAENITISAVQTEAIGNAYLTEQSTKPNDIGLALYDNPVGQLAWIGGKMKLWSGTPPSVLNNTAILTSVSLYYVTDSFLSSVWIYAQNTAAFFTVYTKAATDAPMLFSQFEYNVALYPQEYVAQVGYLVSYTGHFAGLDNPPALIEDLREIRPLFQGLSATSTNAH